MRFPRILIGSLLALAAISASPPAALAASVPAVQGVQEVAAPDDGGRLLLVYGQFLTKVTGYELARPDGVAIGTLPVVFQSRTLAAVKLPATLTPAAYTLPGNFTLRLSTRTATSSVEVRLTGGCPDSSTVATTALNDALRSDLDDAATVGGETTAELHDAALLTGVVAPTLFSAYDDLAAESRIGSAADQVAAGDHLHDARYPLRTELAAPGTVNAPGNPIEWSQIRGVPSGLADGVDDTGATAYTAGTGLVLVGGQFSALLAGNGTAGTIARSDHDHDAVYAKKAALNAPGGTLNDAANPVDWSRLKNVPAGFADGVDAQQVYDYGAGLTLSGNTFSVVFAGTGSLSSAARSDHTHTGGLTTDGGFTFTGKVDFQTSGDAVHAATGNTASGNSGDAVGGIDSNSPYGIGVAGHGNVGLLGDLDGDGRYAVWGNATYNYQVGVYATTSGSNTTALRARNSGSGAAIEARSYGYGSTTVQVNGTSRSTGVYVNVGTYGTAFRSYTYRGTGAYLQGNGWNSTGLQVNMNSYSRQSAVFQNYGSNTARINSRGAGYFNGGTMSWGADFAESVKSDRPSAEFEPGDVMVIDPKAPRQFALSTDANSTLVAGVVSTRPAMVGSTHDVARGHDPKVQAEEVKLGIVGIVPTKVSDENGAIRIGDLLVTSKTPGHAMKAPEHPAVGTVIGKSLSPLEKGKGKIEVLLMAR